MGFALSPIAAVFAVMGIILTAIGPSAFITRAYFLVVMMTFAGTGAFVLVIYWGLTGVSPPN